MSVQSVPSKPIPSLNRAIATGGIGFALVSLCVFATVAFAEGWLLQHFGLLGSYLIWIALFILLSGAVFGSLVVVRWQLPKFYLLFGLAFFAYAAVWMIAYFKLGRTAGEAVGSLVGSVLMAIIFAAGFRALKSLLKVCVVLFVANFFGYFVGAALFDSISEPAGMLLFGVAYGLFFGAGIGAVLHLVQRLPQIEPA